VDAGAETSISRRKSVPRSVPGEEGEGARNRAMGRGHRDSSVSANRKGSLFSPWELGRGFPTREGGAMER